jgi:small subunit ribosomal protein S18
VGLGPGKNYEEQRMAKYGFTRDARCRFCRDNVSVIDYKDTDTLRKLVTAQGKLFSRKRSGNCAVHQRQLKFAVKRARLMALMAFVE